MLPFHVPTRTFGKFEALLVHFSTISADVISVTRLKCNESVTLPELTKTDRTNAAQKCVNTSMIVCGYNAFPTWILAAILAEVLQFAIGEHICVHNRHL